MAKEFEIKFKSDDKSYAELKISGVGTEKILDFIEYVEGMGVGLRVVQMSGRNK